MNNNHSVKYNNYFNDFDDIDNTSIIPQNNNNNIDTEINIPGCIEDINTENDIIDTKNNIKLNKFNDECVICLDEINLGNKHIEYDTILLECNHAFHYDCYLQWIIDSYQVLFYKTKCPLCNQLVANKSIFYPILRKKYLHNIEMKKM